jgi:hypothetical protein
MRFVWRRVKVWTHDALTPSRCKIALILTQEIRALCSFSRKVEEFVCLADGYPYYLTRSWVRPVCLLLYMSSLGFTSDCSHQVYAFGKSRLLTLLFDVVIFIDGLRSGMWQRRPKNHPALRKGKSLDFLVYTIYTPRLVNLFTTRCVRLSLCPSAVRHNTWCFCQWAQRQPDNTVTWLILPVVICLSQRLSHACLSINNFILWNCERLIISAIIYLMVPYYTDNCSNSRANTCVKSWLLRGRMYLLDKKPMRVLPGFVVNHSNFSNRMASRRR